LFVGLLSHEIGHYINAGFDNKQLNKVSPTGPEYLTTQTSMLVYREGEAAYNNFMVRKEIFASGGPEIDLRGANYQYGQTVANNVYSNMLAQMDKVYNKMLANGSSASMIKEALQDFAASYIALLPPSTTNVPGATYWSDLKNSLRPPNAPADLNGSRVSYNLSPDGFRESVVERKADGTVVVLVDANHDGPWEQTQVSTNGVTTSKNYDNAGNLLNTSAKQSFADGSSLETITKSDGSILFGPLNQITGFINGTFGGIIGGSDLPSASGGYKWSDDGSVGIYISYTAGGGDRILGGLLNSYLDVLKNIMSQAQAQNPAAKLGLIANRLPGLLYDTGGAILTNIDPVTGKDRSIRYNSEGRPVNAVAGSPEFFRTLNEQFIYSALGREAIAPQWEVDTARLQTQAHDPQAGLTELQRAQRNDQLAAAPDKNAGSQTWRPIMLDLNGDGVQVVGKSAANVYFDIDSSGFFKNTSWISKQDGFLVLDRNYNGFIDDGSELFSNGFVADAVNDAIYRLLA